MSDGSQREDLVKKFQSEVDQADWEMLTPHYSRGALFKVDPKVNLFDVAASLGLDDVESVKKYLDEGTLSKAVEADELMYGADKNKFFANFVVVQPYVLFQPYDEHITNS